VRKLLDLLNAFVFLQAVVHKVTIQFTKITVALIVVCGAQ